MKNAIDLVAARRWFAEDVREVAPVVHNQAIVDAFATVPRESYLGDGPWGIHSRLSVGEIHQSKSGSAHHLYHDVLISIDENSGINNGLPSLWARVFDSLDINPGATVVQVGAGVGYYTAILAELVSPQGRVIAYEIETDLAERATRNLAHYGNVEVVHGDATRAESAPTLDALVACAGVTHVPMRWLESLKSDGRMVLPFTGVNQWGFLMHLTKRGDEFPVMSLGPCGFYHCAGARVDTEEQAISEALKFSTGSAPDIAQYHIGQPSCDATRTWVTGQNYWISKT
jgi:protein-L-isoaspartate(D-aspartate) O-methyltransferase